MPRKRTDKERRHKPVGPPSSEVPAPAASPSEPIAAVHETASNGAPPSPGSTRPPLNTGATGGDTPGAGSTNGRTTATACVHIEIVEGGLSNIRSQVAVTARYEGLDLVGTAKAFDRKLDSWLSRAVDLGMICSDLGRLFPVNLERRFQAGGVNVEHLLLLGMGVPGQFSSDDLRYLTCNMTVAVKSMRYDTVCTSLLGTRRNELQIDHAARAFLRGIVDGYDRFAAIVESLTENRDLYNEVAGQPLKITVVEPNHDKARRILDAFKSLENQIPGLQLEVGDGGSVAPDFDPATVPGAVDVEPEVPVTLLHVTRKAGDAPAGAAADPLQVDLSTTVLEFSAISDVAAVTVREAELNAHLVSALPIEMIESRTAEEREEFGTFFSNYLVPDDFRRLVECAANLTLVLDEHTASLPWEMAAFRGFRDTNALATTRCVSRRFHTLLSPPPSCTPPLNRTMKVLVIADPAGGRLSLPFARNEGVAVVEILEQARRAWQGKFEIQVTVRIGSRDDNDDQLARLSSELRKYSDLVVSVEQCDPVRLAVLIVNEQFDVIHYAGHGVFDERSGRAGWVLDEKCLLTAKEIFHARQVPRLVFANACFSAVTGAATSDPRQRRQLVGLAQAFFARGIPNYIGSGWQVDDQCAQELARWFYARALGLVSPGEGHPPEVTAPPATIGEALLEARRAAYALKPESSTWGAYQHYGRVSDKILPFANADQPTEADAASHQQSV